jgi:hypothetical protein
MSGKIEYSVIQIADQQRDERLNAGIVIFAPDGVDVRIPKRLEKLRALSNALDVEQVRFSLEALKSIDSLFVSEGKCSTLERIDLLQSMTPFRLSQPGSFSAPTASSYEEWASRLLQLLVEPEPAKTKIAKKRTRLTTSFKAALRAERVLARKDEGLSAHRVVSNVQIADGLAADFVLKNGAMHVIETVDASSEDISLRKAVSEIAVSALVLEQARMTFGESNTSSKLVYEASSSMEKLALAALEAAAHQGAELFNWASLDDRRRLLTHLAMLADPLPTKREERLAAIHASTQGRFNLN